MNFPGQQNLTRHMHTRENIWTKNGIKIGEGSKEDKQVKKCLDGS